MNSQAKTPNPFDEIIDRLARIESTLVHLKNQYKYSAGSEVMISSHDDNGINLAIKITGLKKKTIYNLVNSRMLPHSKKGKRLYFDEQELRNWIKSGKRKTIEELASM